MATTDHINHTTSIEKSSIELKENYENGSEIDPEFESATVRKIDYRLLIILGGTYAISLIDRTNISIARTVGMGKDLALTVGDRYSIITLVFFIPYILLELPAAILLRKVGARVFLGFIVTGWGAVMLGMAFVQSWQALAVCRTILGIFEAGFFPCCVFLITTWYIRAEVAKRLSIFYLTSQALSGFSNIIGYGMSLLNGRSGLAGWRWIFLLFGVFTVFLGILNYLFVCDFPDKNTFLSAEETQMVMQRLEQDRGDSVPDKLTGALFFSHLSDWKAWAASILFMSATLPAYAFSYFLPIILSGGGYTVRVSLLLSAPPYIAAAFYTFAVAYTSDKTGKRGIFVGLNSLVCLVGLMIMAFGKGLSLGYFGAFLSIMGCQANVPAVLAYQSNNIRSHSKRAVHSALVIGFGGVGGIMASTVFRQVDFPKYIPGLGTAAGCQVLTLIILFVSDRIFVSQNKKVERGELILENLPGFMYTR